ncbi:GntR family transcriptional regulator [Amycolatopsis thermoflava]
MSELMFGEHPEFPDNDEPRYRQIAKEYRQRIIAGELQDGEKLPSEAQLCDIHGVSAITARSAMRLLREWGFAYGIRGKGIFVRRLRKLTRIAPQRYFRGQEARTYVREAEAADVAMNVQHESRRTAAPAAIAARLGINEGDPVMCTRYLIRMGNPPQPVTSSVSWEPLSLTQGTEIEYPHEGEYADKGIVDRFGAIGYYVNQVEEVLDIRTPTAEEARLLEMPVTRPIVEIAQTFRVADRHGVEGDLAVETADILFPADRYELRYVMEIH